MNDTKNNVKMCSASEGETMEDHKLGEVGVAMEMRSARDEVGKGRRPRETEGP